VQEIREEIQLINLAVKLQNALRKGKKEGRGEDD
jgi:hypothetical protein